MPSLPLPHSLRYQFCALPFTYAICTIYSNVGNSNKYAWNVGAKPEHIATVAVVACSFPCISFRIAHACVCVFFFVAFVLFFTFLHCKNTPYLFDTVTDVFVRCLSCWHSAEAKHMFHLMYVQLSQLVCTAKTMYLNWVHMSHIFRWHYFLPHIPLHSGCCKRAHWVIVWRFIWRVIAIVAEMKWHEKLYLFIVDSVFNCCFPVVLQFNCNFHSRYAHTYSINSIKSAHSITFFKFINGHTKHDRFQNYFHSISAALFFCLIDYWLLGAFLCVLWIYMLLEFVGKLSATTRSSWLEWH